MAIGLATTLSAGAAVNTTALQNQLRSLNEAKQNTLQLLNSGKINQATADQRISVLDADIMRAAAAGEGTWVPTLEIVKNADGVPVSKIERKYDDNARLIEAKYYHIYNGDEESAYPNQILTQAYDEAGNQTLYQTISYSDAETKSSGEKWEYAYDANGDITKNYKYTLNISDGKWIENDLYDYAYDEAGRRTMEQNVWAPNEDGKFLGGNKWEKAYDAQGRKTLLSINYTWNFEEQEFVATSKSEYAYTNDILTFEAYSQLIDGKLTLTSTITTTYDAKGFQTSYESMGWNGTELVGQEKWERASNDNWQTTLDASYNWENGKWLPNSKTTTEYGEEFRVYTSYYGAGEEWVPDYKSETPTIGQNGQAQYYWDSDKKDWYLVRNTMNIYNSNGRIQTSYNLNYQWYESEGVRQYSGTKTEYTYDVVGSQSSTTYTWDNEKQDWGTIVAMNISVDNSSTTGIREWGYVSNNGEYGYKSTSYYRTGTLIWTAYYTWDVEKQEFVEVYKDEYKYTLDENGNVATCEIYRAGELIETTYYFYTEVGGTTGIDDVATAGSFKVSGNTITFSEATNVAVYTIDGKMVHNGVTESLTLDAGNVYILKGEGWNKKIAL